MAWADLVNEARKGRGALRHARSALRALRRFRFPLIRPLAALFYIERDLRQQMLPILLKVIYREPLLRYRCSRVGRGLNLYGSLPWIAGQGRIEIGEDVMIGGRNSWIVGAKVSKDAELVIGDGAVVGYQNTFSAACSIRIGARALLAHNVQIYDNPSHPLEPEARLRNESFRLEDCAPVVVGFNAWLGTNVVVLKGVQIGEGSIIGAGSVVTQNIPAGVFAAGNPARVIRTITATASGPPTD